MSVVSTNASSGPNLMGHCRLEKFVLVMRILTFRVQYSGGMGIAALEIEKDFDGFNFNS